MSNKFHFIIAGLRVLSDVDLRAALPGSGDAVPEVTIRQAFELPQDEPPRSLVWHVDGVGHFFMREGREILYMLDPGTDRHEVPIYLVGTCFAALLQQRGHTVLHGSAVSVQHRAMLFCGPSGAGKSTLAAVLSGQGYPVLSDDVCNLSLCAGGELCVDPDGRMLKLWENTLQYLNQEPKGVPVRQGLGKFYTTPAAQESQSQMVGAVYLLELSAADEAPELQRLSTATAMLLVYQMLYRKELVEAMRQQQTCFQMIAALCRQCPIYRLRRPNDLAQMPAVVKLLQHSWAANL